jgi:inhibitor of KinA sporulation pathway (predicted exonuclease)
MKKKPVPSVDSLLVDLILGKEIKLDKKEELYFNAIIIIDDKEEYFERFLETIKRIKSKNIYRYGKNKENVLKAKKIAQLVQSILKELNIDINQEFNEVYEVNDFVFINEGILKLPILEEVLEKLKKENYQKKIRE